MVPAPPSSPAPRLAPSSIVRRLVLAFGANLALFAVALAVVLRATSQLDAADAEVGRLDHAKHAGHRVAALVREQYIHQAHTIIEGNRSHLDHYKDVARATREAIIALRALAEGDEERRAVDEIAALVKQHDDDFLTTTLDAIERGEIDKVRELHAGTERVVSQALTGNKQLNERFERRSDAARARADVLRSRTRWTAVICFGLSALVAAAIALVTTRRIAARVTTLRAGARAIGAGALQTRVGLAGDDEFADIGRSIDEMAADLERHQRDVLRANKLASIGQVAAGVAHEINNPLGVILGYVKTMRRSAARDDEGLDVVEAEARQCKRIVEGLLDLAKPQHLVRETFDVAALVRDSVERLRESGLFDDRVVEGPRGGSVMLDADPGRIRQVMVNVLTNAAEAAPPGGRVEVCVDREANDVAIEVRDSGAGIPAEVRDHLFEPFVTTKKGGVGLGLAIAQAILEAHSGEITCTEDAVAGGTVVRVTLPEHGARAG